MHYLCSLFDNHHYFLPVLNWIMILLCIISTHVVVYNDHHQDFSIVVSTGELYNSLYPSDQSACNLCSFLILYVQCQQQAPLYNDLYHVVRSLAHCHASITREIKLKTAEGAARWTVHVSILDCSDHSYWNAFSRTC